MKKFTIIALLCIGLVFATGCSRFRNDTTDDYPPETTDNGYDNQQVFEPLPVDRFAVPILRAGIFWDDFWYLDAMFSVNNIEWGAPPHLAALSFTRLLPTSGFENLDDIRNFLSAFYSDEWIEAELTGDDPRFVEYDGELFMQGARAGVSRPNWNTAAHELISDDGVNAVVETTVMHYVWHTDDIEPYEVTYTFTFVDGRIDSLTINPN